MTIDEAKKWMQLKSWDACPTSNGKIFNLPRQKAIGQGELT